MEIKMEIKPYLRPPCLLAGPPFPCYSGIRRSATKEGKNTRADRLNVTQFFAFVNLL
jgi:hypothetical protein